MDLRKHSPPMLLCSQLSKLLLLLLALFCGHGAMGNLQTDGEALLRFFSGLQGAARLLNWSNSTSPCTWFGVECNPAHDNVVALKLPGTGLYGTIAAGTLGSLSQLQVLSLRLNHLSGPLPKDLINCMQLKKVFLQSNRFSGPIISFNAASNPLLSVIDMSFNGFTGTIPFSFSSLPHLKILFLQNNSLSGSIPPSMEALSQFNVSDNKLNGSIPRALRSFPNSSFSNNVGLCGPPLSSTCPRSSIAPSSPSVYTASPPSSVVSANSAPYHSSKKPLSTSAIVLIVIADAAFLFLISALGMLWHVKKHASKPEGASAEKMEKGTKEHGFGKSGGNVDDGKEEYSSAQEPEHNKLVFFHGGQLSFDLEDLLRASAEVLGKGTFGTSYKAVLEDGPTVVVKRLREASIGRKEFEQHMDVAGKMRHRNLVPMRAYYYSKEEKLLVHEYLPLGSLLAAIHGRKSSGEPALDWQSRLRISAGAACGLEYLHGTSSKYAHGDIKPCNILLHRDYEACISDYGLAALYYASANNVAAIANHMGAGYQAPEVAKTRKLTQKADVYSFGVVILELLTGKAPSQTSAEQGMDLPKWVQSVVREEWTSEVFDHELMKYNDIEEEMVQMLQIALQCVSPSPDQRPTMAEVLKLIQDIRPFSEPNGGYEEGRSATTTTTRSSSPQQQSVRDSPAAQYIPTKSLGTQTEVEDAPANVSETRDADMPSASPSTTTRDAKMAAASSPSYTASVANVGSTTPMTATAEDATSSMTPTSDTTADVTMSTATSGITPTTMTTTSTCNTEGAMSLSPQKK